jgi:integrase
MVLLQPIFSIAIEWGEASTNPVSVVRKPRQGRRKAVRPLPPEDVKRIRADMLGRNDHRSATLVSVLAYAGLRPGEALALQWRHVRERTLLVEQTVSDGGLTLQKTGRVYRTVDLLHALADDLLEWNPAPHPRRRSCSRAATAIPGAATTGGTGATACSLLPPNASALGHPGHTTCATRSHRC